MLLIKIPSDITKISSYSFADSDIERITIPHHTTKISNFSFYQCRYHHEITFEPNTNLQKNGKFTFYNCRFNTITIQSSFTHICERAFFCCSLLKNEIFLTYFWSKTLGKRKFFITIFHKISWQKINGHECFIKTTKEKDKKIIKNF